MRLLIGIIGAMSIEIEAFRGLMSNCEEREHCGILFTRGSFKGKECVVAVCGVGKVNAAICAQTMILLYSPEIILNIGVAGAISKDVKIGDVVVASAVVQHDFDTTAFGDPKGFIPKVGRVDIPCSAKISESLMQEADLFPEINFHQGIIATGDQFIHYASKLERIASEFGAIACEMEGGSIGQVCNINGVDFCVIRTISDSASEHSEEEYRKFLENAAKTSIKLLSVFLGK